MLLYHSAPGGLCVPPLLLLLLLLVLPVGSLQPLACSPRTTCPPQPAPRLVAVGVFCRGIAASAEAGKIFVGQYALFIPSGHTPLRPGSWLLLANSF
jgi:hypothetical protein